MVRPSNDSGLLHRDDQELVGGEEEAPSTLFGPQSGQPRSNSMIAALAARFRGAAGGAVEASAAEATAELLTAEQVRAATTFNGGRNLPPEAWTKIGGVIGAGGAAADALTALGVAKFQQSQGFPVDGKVGDITLQRISQQPGGAGLEDLVKNDNVLYVGLNPSSRDLEKAALQGSGADVTSVTGARTQDTAKVGGASVDLNDESGLDSYLAQFSQLDAARQAQLKAFFGAAGGEAKDELAQLAKLFYEAEFGKRLWKRVVLSGHSGGWSFWGDENGSIDFSHMAQLSTIFPGAVGQVEDIMLSACNTGQKDRLGQFTAIFPNLKTIWAYVGYSPSAATGSIGHVKEWEKSTRGRADTAKVDAGREKIGRGSGSKDDNVAIWSRETGAADATYKTNSPEANLDFSTLKATVDAGLVHYDAAYDRGVIDQSALNELYTQLQALVGNFSTELAAERDRYDQMMRKTLNLRHWTNVLRHYMAEHGAALKAAWGSAMPRDFGTQSRSKVLGYIGEYPGDKANEAYVKMVSMLKNLEGIPETWN